MTPPGESQDSSCSQVDHTDAGSASVPRNVVLTGFMGTGKTTVGRFVARQLRFGFVDTDAVIVERHGPIADIFADQGEAAFRKFEFEVAVDLGTRKGLVIATGGGLVLDPRNVEALGSSGRWFALTASVDEIYRRVRHSPNPRPLLDGENPRQRIAELLDERSEVYRQFDQVDTTGRSPADIAAEIAERFRPVSE